MSEMCVLLVHGMGGSGPWHWQQWLASQLPRHGVTVDRPTLPDPARPAIDAWLPVLRQRLAAVPASAELVVAAHSLGAALWLHHAATIDRGGRRADRVLLVAPPDPDWRDCSIGGAGTGEGLVPYPTNARALRRAAGVTRLVAGTGGEQTTMYGAHALADQLQVEMDVLADGANINTDSGYGPWPSLLRWALYGSVPLQDRFDDESHTAGCSPERLRLV